MSKFVWLVSDLDFEDDVEKGDYPGHPFRGNQWVQFGGKSLPLQNNPPGVIKASEMMNFKLEELLEKKGLVEDTLSATLKASVASETYEAMKEAGVTDEEILGLYEEVLADLQAGLYHGQDPQSSTIRGASTIWTDPAIQSDALNGRNHLATRLNDFLEVAGVEFSARMLTGFDTYDEYREYTQMQTVKSRDLKVVLSSGTKGELIVQTTLKGPEGKPDKVVYIRVTDFMEELGSKITTGYNGRGTQYNGQEFRELFFKKTSIYIDREYNDGVAEFTYKYDYSGMLDFAGNEKIITTPVARPVNVVGGLVAQWANSSGSAGSLLVGESVSRLLGGTKWKPTQMGSIEAGYETDKLAKIAKLSPSSKKVVDTFTKVVYDRTQKMLKEAGIKEVTLIRGVTGSAGFDYDSGRRSIVTETGVRVGGRTLQSFTQASATALDFASETFGENFLVLVKVPASRVFSTPATGLGCQNEYEAVLISKPGDKATIIQFDWSTSSSDAIRAEIDKAIKSGEIDVLSKKAIVVQLDNDLNNSDWLRSTFDLPGVNTLQDYLDALLITTPQEAQSHIDSNRHLNYWKGVPARIKSDLALYAMYGQVR